MKVMSYLATKHVLASILMICIGWAYVDGFQLTVLHTNDIHSRIEQTNKYLGVCKKEDVGGFIRTMFKLQYKNYKIIVYGCIFCFKMCK